MALTTAQEMAPDLYPYVCGVSYGAHFALTEILPACTPPMPYTCLVADIYGHAAEWHGIMVRASTVVAWNAMLMEHSIASAQVGGRVSEHWIRAGKSGWGGPGRIAGAGR